MRAITKPVEDPAQDVAEFEIQMLLPVGMTIVVFAIGIAYGLSVLSDTRDDIAECATGYNYNSTSLKCVLATNSSVTANPTNAAFNATTNGMTAVAKFPEKLGLIVTVIIAAVVIGILVRYLFVRYG